MDLPDPSHPSYLQNIFSRIFYLNVSTRYNLVLCITFRSPTLKSSHPRNLVENRAIFKIFTSLAIFYFQVMRSYKYRYTRREQRLNFVIFSRKKNVIPQMKLKLFLGGTFIWFFVHIWSWKILFSKNSKFVVRKLFVPDKKENLVGFSKLLQSCIA